MHRNRFKFGASVARIPRCIVGLSIALLGSSASGQWSGDSRVEIANAGEAVAGYTAVTANTAFRLTKQGVAILNSGGAVRDAAGIEYRGEMERGKLRTKCYLDAGRGKKRIQQLDRFTFMTMNGEQVYGIKKSNVAEEVTELDCQSIKNRILQTDRGTFKLQGGDCASRPGAKPIVWRIVKLSKE